MLGLLALVLLWQMFVVPQALENAALGFQILLGEAFFPLLDRIARGIQSVLCIASGVLIAGGGVVFALGRALLRINQQDQRIQELEARLAVQDVGAATLPQTTIEPQDKS